MGIISDLFQLVGKTRSDNDLSNMCVNEGKIVGMVIFYRYHRHIVNAC